MILVTGATGLLGNCIVRELLERGESVRVLCRKNTPRDAIAGLNVEVHDGDLSKEDILRRAVEGCSAVVHSAAMIHIGWQKMDESRSVNVEGTRRLARACIEHHAKLIHVSTVDTLQAAKDLSRPIRESDPRPGLSTTDESVGTSKLQCAYVVSKTEAEQAARDAVVDGLQLSVVHPGFMLGPYDWKPSSGRMMLQVAKAPVLLAPAGGCSVCDARDVASGCVNAIERGRNGQSYILAGENMSYQHLWQRMLAAVGKRKSVRVARPQFLHRVGRTLDAAIRGLRLTERDLNGAMIGMGNLYHYYDSSLAKDELGYQTRPVEETLRDAWQWLKAR